MPASTPRTRTVPLPRTPARARRSAPAPLTISRKALLSGSDDRKFRELVHAFFAFQARHEAIRDGHAAFIGLAGIQYTLLISIGHLEAEGDVSSATLCEHLRVSSAFIAVEVAKLVERGLVTKTRDPRDARRILLRTTAAGHALLARLAPVQRSVNDVEFDGITQREFELLHDIMGRLIANCDAALALQRLLEQPASRGLAQRLEETAA